MPLNNARPDLYIQTAPASWALRIVEMERRLWSANSEDLHRVYASVVNHQTSVLVPANRREDPDAILGAVCRETLVVERHSPSGQIFSNQDLKLPHVFGLCLEREQQHQDRASRILNISSVEAALDNEDGEARSVFSYLDVDCPSLHALRCMIDCGYRVASHDGWDLSSEEEPDHFTRWLDRNSRLTRRTMVGILRGEYFMRATSDYARLFLGGVTLPDGQRIAYFDVSRGRNAIVGRAVTLGCFAAWKLSV
jgi:hypothetical protein